MAYTNAIFYIDLINGSDAARTSLTSCTASNPSGTITRITKTGHGLTTGAVVVLTLFSTWLNSSWKITVVDANNFDLDDAVWQTTADASGTVSPRGGSSWADAWKTITNGATSARIAAGDIIRISKTPDPVSIGNATWTDLSKTVTLATAQNTTIENCESAWTASANVTASTSTTRKQGAVSAQLVVAAGFTTGKLAYKAIGSTLDLSAYQKISFCLSSSAALTASWLKICLCSDTIGDVIVDTFYVPAVVYLNSFRNLTVTKNGGGNLGASIQSIAIYANSDPGTPTILLDNFIACTTNGLNLQSLISKNGNAQGGDMGFYAIANIDGANVMLDNSIYSNAATTGYAGTTETVETFMRSTFITTEMSSSTGNASVVNKSGTSISYVEYQGGYNTTTNIQDGETFFDGLTGSGVGLYCYNNYVKINRLNFSRYYYGIHLQGTGQIVDNTLSICNNQQHGMYINGSTTENSYKNTFNNLVDVSFNYNGGINVYGSSVGIYNNIKRITSNGYQATGGGLLINISSGNKFSQIDLIKNNGRNGINMYGGSNPCDSNVFENIDEISYCYYSGIDFSGNSNYFKKIGIISNCILRAVLLMEGSSNNELVIETINNTNGLGFYISSGPNFIKNTTIEAPLSTVNFYYKYTGCWLWSLNHNNVVGAKIGYTSGGTSVWQNSVVHSLEVGAWKTNITGSHRDSLFPIKLKIAAVPFEADKEVTVTAWVKKEHATDIACRLVTYDNVAVGITETSSTKANDTDWEQLSISFTPTEMGVTEIYLETWITAVTTDISSYIGTISVSQA